MKKDDYLLGLIIDLKLLTPEQLAAVRKLRDGDLKDMSIPDILILIGRLNPDQVLQAKGAQFGADIIHLDTLHLDDETIRLITPAVAREYRIIPISKRDNLVQIAFADPSDLNTLDSFAHLLNVEIHICIALESDIQAALDKYYPEKKPALAEAT